MIRAREFELKVIAAACRGGSELDVVVKQLARYKWADEALGWIWEQFKDLKTRGEKPSITSLLHAVQQEDVKAHDKLKEVIAEVYQTRKANGQSVSASYDCDQLVKSHTRTAMSQAASRGVDALARGDLDGAQTAFKGAVEQPINGTHLQIKGLVDMETWDHLPTIHNGIPTGIQKLDTELMGGLTREEQALLIGMTNMGKSIFGINIGYNAYKHKFRVLHCDTENGEEVTRWRYMARITGKSTKSLLRHRAQKDPDFTEWAKRNMARFDKWIKILPIGVGMTTLEDLKGFVADLQDSEDWTPDLVIIDSPDHILVPSSSDNIALDAKRTYEGLKGWWQQLKCAAVVTTQAKNAQDRIATNKDIAWGVIKAQHSDIMMSVNPGIDDDGKMMDEQTMGARRTLYLGKVRNAGSRFIVHMKGDWKRAKVYQDLSRSKGMDLGDVK